MDPQLFAFIVEVLRHESGLALNEEKAYLVESRLQPVARSHGFQDVPACIMHLRDTNDAMLRHDIVQAMTTNETMFFRDNKPFERLRNHLLPALNDAGKLHRPLSIWSAACSSGQEPYSIAISILEETAKYPGLSGNILASDLCEKALAKAKEGQYTQFEVQRGLPIQMLVKYFEQREGNQWQIKDAIRQNITYQNHNLMEGCSHLGRFDLIFCRNVLIYFDEDTKKAVLAKLASVLEPHGYLILGSAETVLGITDQFKSVPQVPGIYQLQ